MGMSRPAVESTLFRARRRLTEEYDDIVSGARCLRIEQIIGTAVDSRLGARDTRRLARHLRTASPAAARRSPPGWTAASSRARASRERVASRVAALLPFPVLVRFRRGGGADAAAAAAAARPLERPPAAALRPALERLGQGRRGRRAGRRRRGRSGGRAPGHDAADAVVAGPARARRARARPRRPRRPPTPSSPAPKRRPPRPATPAAPSGAPRRPSRQARAHGRLALEVASLPRGRAHRPPPTVPRRAAAVRCSRSPVRTRTPREARRSDAGQRRRRFEWRRWRWVGAKPKSPTPVPPRRRPLRPPADVPPVTDAGRGHGRRDHGRRARAPRSRRPRPSTTPSTA